VVNDVGAAFGLAESFGLDPVVEIARDDGTSVRLTRNPIELSATPPGYRTAPPRLEDHVVADHRKEEGADV
jgi:crotonobetainyl-CoA:carnitine CoA-transferase CaiB-like acyl-CoA transferase